MIAAIVKTTPHNTTNDEETTKEATERKKGEKNRNEQFRGMIKTTIGFVYCMSNATTKPSVPVLNNENIKC